VGDLPRVSQMLASNAIGVASCGHVPFNALECWCSHLGFYSGALGSGTDMGANLGQLTKSWLKSEIKALLPSTHF